MPIFVRIDEYREVLDVVNMVKTKIAEAHELVAKIQDLRNREDAELERWEQGVAAIQRKVEFIDKSLFEPEAL